MGSRMFTDLEMEIEAHYIHTGTHQQCTQTRTLPTSGNIKKTYAENIQVAWLAQEHLRFQVFN